jgi:hypothetical protein
MKLGTVVHGVREVREVLEFLSLLIKGPETLQHHSQSAYARA